MSQRFSTDDGRALAYERRGSGPVLVCHPGGPGFSARLFDDAAGLDESFTLVLLDPRGTGGSDRPVDDEAYRIEDYVDDLEQLRRHLGLEAIELLGWSHGGIVAMAYAAAHPARVAHLVLVGALARFQAEQEDAMREAMEQRADEPWYADAVAALEQEQAGTFGTDAELGELAFREFPLYFASYGERERAYLERMREPANGDTLRFFNQEIWPTFDLRPQLSRIDAPTLILAGEQDFICGPTCAKDIGGAIPGAKTVLIPGAGHFLFLEAADRLRDEVTRFVRG